MYPDQQYNIKDASQVQLMADLLLSSAGAPWFQSYLDLSRYSEKTSEEGWILVKELGLANEETTSFKKRLLCIAQGTSGPRR